MQLSVHIILFINAMLMSVAAFFSFLFWVTGYAYFWIFAVPLTAIGCFKKYSIPIAKVTILKILWTSTLFVGISYFVSQPFVLRLNYADSPFLEQLFWFAPNINYWVLISSLLITLSTFVLVYFVTEVLPEFLIEKINPNLRFTGFYKTTILTMLSVFTIDYCIKWEGFWEIERFIIFPLFWMFIFYLTPYLYIKSFETLDSYKAPSLGNKIFFTIILASIYLLFVTINISNYSLPHMGV
jgi:hypothetical protein